MEVIIGIACVIGLLGLLRWHGTTKLAALVAAGAIQRPSDLHTHPGSPEFIPLASIGNHGYDNLICARLQGDGVVLTHKGSKQAVLLPLALLTTTDKKWTYPLEFGRGSNRIGLNLGNAVSAFDVQRMKQKKAANQASDATSEPAPGAASSSHQG